MYTAFFYGRSASSRAGGASFKRRTGTGDGFGLPCVDRCSQAVFAAGNNNSSYSKHASGQGRQQAYARLGRRVPAAAAQQQRKQQ